MPFTQPGAPRLFTGSSHPAIGRLEHRSPDVMIGGIEPPLLEPSSAAHRRVLDHRGNGPGRIRTGIFPRPLGSIALLCYRPEWIMMLPHHVPCQDRMRS